MAKYRKISDLFDAVEKEVSKVLRSNSFIELVKESMIEMINKDVYDSYKPQFYDRKREKGGLTDKSNIKPEFDENNKTTLRVKNIRKEVGSDLVTTSYHNIGRYITPIIVTGRKGNIGREGGGDGYNFFYPYYSDTDEFGRTYVKPRNFLKSTVEDLQENNKAKNALKKELQRNKIKVK